MTAKCVFVSDHPDVLACWQECRATNDRWNQMCADWERDYPNQKVMFRGHATGKKMVALEGPTVPGPAWRSDRPGWVPFRNHKQDRTIVDRFDATKVTWDWLPGMPDVVITWGEGTRWFNPGVDLVDGRLFVSWGCAAESVKVDADLWSPSKLSEFYAAKGE